MDVSVFLIMDVSVFFPFVAITDVARVFSYWLLVYK